MEVGCERILKNERETGKSYENYKKGRNGAEDTSAANDGNSK